MESIPVSHRLAADEETLATAAVVRPVSHVLVIHGEVVLVPAPHEDKSNIPHDANEGLRRFRSVISIIPAPDDRCSVYIPCSHAAIELIREVVSAMVKYALLCYDMIRCAITCELELAFYDTIWHAMAVESWHGKSVATTMAPIDARA